MNTLHRTLFGVAVGCFLTGISSMPGRVFGAPDPSNAAQQAAAQMTKIDLNSATVDELEQLPGVGQATAKKIIAGRPYKTLDDLSKAGISKSEVEKISPLVMVEKSSNQTGASVGAAPAAAVAGAQSGQKVDLNTASEKDLLELPGVGEATAKKIIAGRPYQSVDGLADAGISKAEIGKLTPLVEVAAAPGARTSDASASNTPANATAGAKVDLNSASEKDLLELPGVGESTAKKIIAGRPYKSVDDLANAGVSKNEIARLTPLVDVGSASSAVAGNTSAAGAKVDLNTASEKDLLELPGVGEATAKKIIAGRPYKSVDDLANAGVSKTEIAKLTPLVEIGAASSAVRSTDAAGAGASANVAAGAKVDLNSASEKDLLELPGVGEATAKKIIAGRPYKTLDDLAKAGVSEREVTRLTPLVVVGPAAAAAAAPEAQPAAARDSGVTPGSTPKSSADASTEKVNLNGATEKELEDLPGVGPVTAQKIIASRPFQNEQDLSRAGLSASEIQRISPLVMYGPEESAGPARTPPQQGMVWVNTQTKVYHVEGDRWYGKTKEGKFMTEDDAKKAGYHESKQVQKSAVNPSQNQN